MCGCELMSRTRGDSSGGGHALMVVPTACARCVQKRFYQGKMVYMKHGKQFVAE